MNYLIRNCFVLISLFAVSFAMPVAADNWANFRGPDGRGVSDATTIPTKVAPDDFIWKVALPGRGHSSPVVWNDLIYLTGMDAAGERLIFCLKTSDGSVNWKKALRFNKHGQHRYNSFASSTPCVDESGVYIAWSNGDSIEVLAFDHEGEKRWNKSLGKFSAKHGSGSSPMIVGETLIIANDNEGNESFLIGLSTKDGTEKWKRQRASSKASYATPVLYESPNDVKGVLFACTSHGLTCLDPVTGELQWEFNPRFDQRVVGSPAVAGDVIFYSAGSGVGGKQSIAIKVETVGGEDKPRKIWELSRALPYVPSGVVHDDHIFIWADGGIVSCIAAENGEITWQERIGGNFFGSPVLINGHLYCLSMQGKLVVIKAATTFEKVHELDLGEPSQATPAIADGVMYLRTEGHLIAVGGEKVN